MSCSCCNHDEENHSEHNHAHDGHAYGEEHGHTHDSREHEHGHNHAHTHSHAHSHDNGCCCCGHDTQGGALTTTGTLTQEFKTKRNRILLAIVLFVVIYALELAGVLEAQQQQPLSWEWAWE